ncbi:MAG TPA: polysaccharide biosynthesis tyrosine autokinase [Phycisphaerales bacterium]|nr:polysaccharide biosynthesis tyrosine autokinase [Phycisphaerales bacterium]
MTTLPASAAPVMNQPARMGSTATPPAALAAQAGSIDPLKLLNKYKLVLGGAAVAGAVLGVGAHLVLRTVAPKWSPVAIFNCLPPQEDVGGANAQYVGGQEMDRFMQTQVRMMTSDIVLAKVAEDPQLINKASGWAKQFLEVDGSTGMQAPRYDKMTEELRDIVGARVLPQTNLIELSVSDSNKEDATEILRLVREKYTLVLKSQTQDLSDDRVKAIRDQIDRYDIELKNLARKRDGLVTTMSLDAIRDAANATRMLLANTEEELQQVSLSLQSARKRLTQMQEQQQAGGFSPELLANIEKDPAVLEVQSMISKLETTRQMLLNRGLSPDHREVRMVDANLEGARQNLERVKSERLAKMFAGELDELAKGVAQLESQEEKLVQESGAYKRRLTDLTTAQGQLDDIENQIRTIMASKADTTASFQNLLSLQQMGSFNRVVLLQPEKTPNEMSFPKWKLMLPAGMILCVGLVGGLVVLREVVDQRVKGPSDISIIPRTKLLGWVPEASEDPSGVGATETAFRDRPRGIVAESFRQIRGSVAKRVAAADHKTLLVIAGMPGSGATSAVSNLAFAFAAADKRVLVVDANFRRPSLHRVMGLSEGKGLADVLARSVELTDAIQATSTPNLDVLSAGSKEHRVFERLATDAMTDVLNRARQDYDLILIDCAPAIVAGDGVALAHRCDASILVVRALAEKRGMIARVKNELSDGRSEFLGVVVNAVRSSSGGYMKGNIRAAHEYQQA